MSDQKKFTFVFEKAEGKRMLAVTGAIGGPNPEGSSVIAHLFVEHPSIPNIETHDVDENGRVDISKGGDPIRRGDVTREIQTTLVMSPETALSLSRWLERQSQVASERREARKRDTDE